MTADELLRLPGDGFRYELVRGELRKGPLGGAEHGQVAARIGTLLWKHVEAGSLGTCFAAGTGFQLARDPDTVIAPDAAFVRKQRLGESGRVEGYLPGAPDLAAEVVSPEDTFGEVQEKVLEWLDAGTGMVIVVNLRGRTSTIYQSRYNIRVLGEGDEIDGADVVPGWKVPVRELFG